MICGDMDSIRPEVSQYYEAKGVNIVKQVDQYSTDITKCMFHSRDRIFTHVDHDENSQIDIAIFGGLGGRADQAFSQLHHLYAIPNQSAIQWKGDIYLITPESLMFVLEKGLNRIHAPVGSHSFTENVGIIPIARPAHITTRGLEWDVTDWYTEFGGQISTSNHIKAGVVEIECTERVLFTLEYA